MLDFDHVDVDATKKALGTDDFIYSCWTSPSGNGVKALVQITNPERHRDHFRALIKYFERTHGLELDESGINESRACFESYDPDLIVKEDYKKFGHFTTEHAEADPYQRSLRLHGLHEAQPGLSYDSPGQGRGEVDDPEQGSHLVWRIHLRRQNGGGGSGESSLS